MKSIGYSETSVTNYKSTLRNSPPPKKSEEPFYTAVEAWMHAKLVSITK